MNFEVLPVAQINQGQNVPARMERMTKIGFVLLSMIPGIVFAKDNTLPSKIRVMVRTPENVVNTIPLIQKISSGLGVPRINLTIDSEINAVELLVQREESADILVGKLKSILGEDVLVEKLIPDSMAFGTQDDIMKP